MAWRRVREPGAAGRLGIEDSELGPRAVGPDLDGGRWLQVRLERLGTKSEEAELVRDAKGGVGSHGEIEEVISTGLGGWEMERVGVFSATRLRVLWRQAPRPGILCPPTRHKAWPQEPDTSPGFLSAPSSLLKGHHRQQNGSGMCHPEPPPVMWSVLPDADAVPLRDGRRASAAWPWRCPMWLHPTVHRAPAKPLRWRLLLTTPGGPRDLPCKGSGFYIARRPLLPMCGSLGPWADSSAPPTASLFASGTLETL